MVVLTCTTFNEWKNRMRIFVVSCVITSLLMVSCQQQPANLNPGIITLGVIPENSGTIHTNVNSFQVGDHIILTAAPNPGRVFFKWVGTSVSYNPVAEFDVTTKDGEYVAVFPVKILADSQVFITNYPPHTLSIGEMAEFEIGLNLPLDSTYTVYCVCNSYSDFTFGMYVHGDVTSVKAGCKNTTPKSQNTWTISVKSNKTDSTVVSERITYDVEWQ